MVADMLTLNGNKLVVRKYKNGRVTVNGTALVTTADVDASNGVIHVINRVLGVVVIAMGLAEASKPLRVLLGQILQGQVASASP